MKNILSYYLMLAFSLLIITVGCQEDDPGAQGMPPMANIGMDQTVDLEKRVTLDASSSTGSGVSYNWMVTDPDGNSVVLDDAGAVNPSFVASIEGSYSVSLEVINSSGSTMANGTVTAVNPTYALADQMGRPGINTLFNFFASSQVKNDFNLTMPSGPTGSVEFFEGSLDLLQEYIGLDSDSYTNVLGLDNTTTSTVLSNDVLTSNLNFPASYGPSDLDNIVPFQNVLNGRRLQDDVIDVTLILIFAGNDLASLNSIQQGLIGDNINTNDVAFLSSFPYLAAPN